MTDLATLDIRIIVLILVVALLTARSVGKGLGERLLHEGGRKPSKFDDASMRLLSLLLAFTFGMSIQRHDQRRLAVVADANAIGDFYTCASILKEPLRTKLQDVIRQYAQLRLQTSFFLTRHNATTWIWDVGRGGCLLRGSVVQRHPRLPAHVVCRESQPRQRESDFPGARR